MATLARAALYIAAATLLVHVFAPTPLAAPQTLAHVAAVCLCFTSGYALVLMTTPRLARKLPERWANAPLVRIWAPSLIATLIGVALLRGVSAAAPVALHFDHGDDAWGVKMVAVWVALTATLHQAEHARRLSLELAGIGAQARSARSRPASASASIQIDVDGRPRSLSLDTIVFIKAEENYCLLRCVHETLLTRATMTNLERDLPSEFVRVHRSFLINLRHVTDVQFASAWRAYQEQES